ncbi:MAG: hypothetical protein J7J87_01835 [Candidatus Diapherotrites archaeon]|nr:hypothetical protein [Candidatus Diapherotrites archaeon]
MGIKSRIVRRKAFPKATRVKFNALTQQIEAKSSRRIGPVKIESSTKYTPKGKFVSSWKRVERPSLRKPGRRVIKTTIVSREAGKKEKLVIKEVPGKAAYETKVTKKIKSFSRKTVRK